MIIPLTPSAQMLLAAAVDNLIQNPHTAPEARALEFFKRLNSHDRGRLVAAQPADVFRTALASWYNARPSIKRGLAVAGLVMLQAARIVPSIAEAQRKLKAQA